jgi:hypothetical protein
MPARAREPVQAGRGLMGRRWTILKGGKRGSVLMGFSSGEALWRFEQSHCRGKRRLRRTEHG